MAARRHRHRQLAITGGSNFRAIRNGLVILPILSWRRCELGGPRNAVGIRCYASFLKKPRILYEMNKKF